LPNIAPTLVVDEFHNSNQSSGQTWQRHTSKSSISQELVDLECGTNNMFNDTSSEFDSSK
jgi:hypothetical protein